MIKILYRKNIIKSLDLVRVMMSFGRKMEIYLAFPEIIGDHYENPSRGLQEGLESFLRHC